MNKAIKDHLIAKLSCDMYSLQMEELTSGVLFRGKIRSSFIQLKLAISELEQLKEEEDTPDVQVVLNKHLRGVFINNETDDY